MVNKAECLEACRKESLLCQVAHALGLLCSVLGGVLSHIQPHARGKTNYIHFVVSCQES